MKKRNKILAIILSVIMALTIVPISLFASAEPNYGDFIVDGVIQTGVGDYELKNYDELIAFVEKVNEGNSYKGSNFIIADKFVGYDGQEVPRKTISVYSEGLNKTWTPIGKKNPKGDTFREDRFFSGSFDGNGYTITGLSFGAPNSHIADVTETTFGFFGYIKGATIKNLAIQDSNFYIADSGKVVAPLVAYSDAFVEVDANGNEKSRTPSKIENCAVRDNVKIDVNSSGVNMGSNIYSGLVGYAVDTTVDGCYSNAEIIVNSSNEINNIIGGLVGENGLNSTVLNSYFNGNATSVLSDTAILGGIVGRNLGEVANCYNVGMVTGKRSAAIVGMNAGLLKDPKDPNSAFELKGKVSNCLYYYDSALAAGYKQKDATGNYDKTNIGMLPFNVNDPKNIVDVVEGAVVSPATLAAKLNGTKFDGTIGENSSVLITNNKYPFPTIKDNPFGMLPLAEDTTNYNGGSGAVYDPFIITEAEKFYNLQKNVNKAFRLDAAIDLQSQAKEPIDLFMGLLDGNSQEINNINVKPADASANRNSAWVVENIGTIKDVTVSGTISTSGIDTNVAAVATYNDGIIENVKANVDVTTNSDNFKTNVGGLVAINNGTIKGSENSGVILAKFSDKALAKTNAQIKEEAKINVGGAVAVNTAKGEIDTCGENSSARSELIAAKTISTIKVNPYVANDARTTTASSEDKVDTTKAYLELNEAAGGYSLPDKAYGNENPISPDDVKAAATIHPDDTHKTGEAVIGKTDNNYQRITFKYTDGNPDEPKSYTSTFLAWIPITDSIKVNTEGVKVHYLAGENFSSTGLKVIAGDNITLKPAKDENDKTGYLIKIYKTKTGDDQLADPIASIDNFKDIPVTDSDTKTVYVAIEYDGKVVGSYPVQIHNIKSIEITDNQKTYMAGQKPNLKVMATYSDPKSTRRTLDAKEYDVKMGLKETELAVKDTFSAGMAGETVYVSVSPKGINYNVSVNTVSVTVLGNDAVIPADSITFITSDEKNATEVKDSEILIKWNGFENVKYKVERKQKNPDGSYPTDWTSVKDGTTSTECLDKLAKIGETYKYKITVNFAGELSSKSVESEEITAAVPIRFNKVNIDRAKRYAGYKQKEFKIGAITAEAEFNNGSTAELKTTGDIKDVTKEKCRHQKLYVVSNPDFDLNTAGNYTFTVKYWGRTGEINPTGKELSYVVKVVLPKRIAVEAIDYKAYPTGYDKPKFESGLIVKAHYNEEDVKPENKIPLASYGLSPQKTSGDGGFTTDFNSSVAKKPYSVNVFYAVGDKTLKTTIDGLKIVENKGPENVKVEKQNDGSLRITWDAVEGATKYDIEKANGAIPIIYFKTGEKMANDDNDSLGKVYAYDDEYLDYDVQYSYRVTPYIAGQKAPSTKAVSNPDALWPSSPISPEKPAYIKAVFEKGFKTKICSMDPMDIDHIKVYAYYPKDGKALTAEDFDTLKPLTKEEQASATVKYTCREVYKKELLSSNHRFTIEGTSANGNKYDHDVYDKDKTQYTLKVLYKDKAEFNGKPIGSNTFTVFPVSRMVAKLNPEDYNHIVGTDFKPSLIKVDVFYDDDPVDLEKPLKQDPISDKSVSVDFPTDMNTPGIKTLKVTFKKDPRITTTVKTYVYDPDKELVIRPNKTFERMSGADRNFLIPVQPNTRLISLKNLIENPKENVKIIDSAGKEVKRTYVATGDTVMLKINNDPKDFFQIVVYGDLNDDGIVNALDSKALLNVAYKKSVFKGEAYDRAADLTPEGNDTNGRINALDYRKHINYLASNDKNKKLGQ